MPGRRDAGAPVCRDCAGITRDFFCDRCGFEGSLLGGRLCERCTLAAALGRLLDDGTGRVAVRPEAARSCRRSAIPSSGDGVWGRSCAGSVRPVGEMPRRSMAMDFDGGSGRRKAPAEVGWGPPVPGCACCARRFPATRGAAQSGDTCRQAAGARDRYGLPPRCSGNGNFPYQGDLAVDQKCGSSSEPKVYVPAAQWYWVSSFRTAGVEPDLLSVEFCL